MVLQVRLLFLLPSLHPPTNMPLVLHSVYELSPVIKPMLDCLVMRQDKPASRECLTSVHERDGTLLNLNEQECMSYSPRLGSIY
jgi:hypothetical protein